MIRRQPKLEKIVPNKSPNPSRRCKGYSGSSVVINETLGTCDLVYGDIVNFGSKTSGIGIFIGVATDENPNMSGAYFVNHPLYSVDKNRGVWVADIRDVEDTELGVFVVHRNLAIDRSKIKQVVTGLYEVAGTIPEHPCVRSYHDDDTSIIEKTIG